MICEIMPILNPLTVFGTIFLIMTIVSGITMKKEVNNPNCPEEVRSVRYNKKWFVIILIVYIVIVLLGIILYLI